jgi:ribosomal protein L11 methyltransferase
MNYFELLFTLSPCTETACDILSGLLADAGFESFEETEKGLKAYVAENLFDETAVKNILNDFPLSDVNISYIKEYIKSQDWNEEWEKNYFQPIIIDNQVVIHSSFHKDFPKLKYDIVIDPRMAFGTGHHATTSMMTAFLLESEIEDKTVLDMGCGTAVLAILARMKGALKVAAIDNDRWAYENALENIALNGTPDIAVSLGDAGLLGAEKFDFIFANINRNILLNDIPKYAQCLNMGGTLYVSGFYAADIPLLVEKSNESGLKFAAEKSENEWRALKFIKSPLQICHC